MFSTLLNNKPATGYDSCNLRRRYDRIFTMEYGYRRGRMLGVEVFLSERTMFDTLNIYCEAATFL